MRTGRPTKFTSVAALGSAINAYFDQCDQHLEKGWVVNPVTNNPNIDWKLTPQLPYTLSGLARSLKLSRRTLLRYSYRDDFCLTVTRAKQRCEGYAEEQLFNPRGVQGAIFNLRNNYGWK